MVWRVDQAPDFELATDGDGSLELGALKGGIVVLHFHPKDDTSGCAKEAMAFTELAGAFAARETEVVGVSPDPAACHDRVKAKHGSSVRLAATRNSMTSRAPDCIVSHCRRLSGNGTSSLRAARTALELGRDDPRTH